MAASYRPYGRAAFLHHSADQAHRGGQPGLLPAMAWRRGVAATPRASLVAARTETEEAVYEAVMPQAVLVEDLQGRGRHERLRRSGACGGTSSWSRRATPSLASVRDNMTKREDNGEVVICILGFESVFLKLFWWVN
ncbi:uncharacterized protein LOC119349001 [Triticum dicoccoides]|uniref:uncharacterized protein LOC119349001 n=1 Tax=Triticum dicoccoides TaxID=85692 RepID=UPI00188E970E|nr:uncharacterized protein LOC119349001 [Triticum dicoccoides]